MEKAFAKVEELADTIKEYVNTRIDAVKLNAAEKSSSIIANIVAGLIVLAVFIFFLPVLPWHLAWAIGLGRPGPVF